MRVSSGAWKEESVRAKIVLRPPYVPQERQDAPRNELVTSGLLALRECLSVVFASNIHAILVGMTLPPSKLRKYRRNAAVNVVKVIGHGTSLQRSAGKQANKGLLLIQAIFASLRLGSLRLRGGMGGYGDLAQSTAVNAPAFKGAGFAAYGDKNCLTRLV